MTSKHYSNGYYNEMHPQSQWTEVQMNPITCEAEANLTIGQNKTSVVWGRITNCHGLPVAGALVCLYERRGCRGEAKRIAQTHTDCSGYYRFELPCCKDTRYVVSVTETDEPMASPKQNCITYY